MYCEAPQSNASTCTRDHNAASKESPHMVLSSVFCKIKSAIKACTPPFLFHDRRKAVFCT
ncbi:hypothetical protein SNOG_06408 [Parastagonospora nodorum SN15]|uniref:Uncharacterized protein n=1 Tax=Phaeosphaeria nodorum (strain SN15 / ATCC MYA-4574 / FGSC 10173) TaxID=321614 RepID=Q0UPA6_PHANO|nr:hypothetical protein SNOG_06408 [Parastagonospora nodorum SN15]EAT86239.1 hypothetical protein SNOG_06408 [Parastagonospora nodorum SN15]